MSQGVIILIVIGVLFAGMYLFALKFANIRQKRAIRKQKRLELQKEMKFQKIKEEHKGIRELIDEKYRLAAERSNAIKEELKVVKQFKEDIDKRYS
jgi:hypothetical protein